MWISLCLCVNSVKRYENIMKASVYMYAPFLWIFTASKCGEMTFFLTVAPFCKLSSRVIPANICWDLKHLLFIWHLSPLWFSELRKQCHQCMRLSLGSNKPDPLLPTVSMKREIKTHYKKPVRCGTMHLVASGPGPIRRLQCEETRVQRCKHPGCL